MKKKLLAAVGMVILVILLVFGTYNYYTVTQDTIVVGYLPSNHDSALFVADALGMYKKEGLKVQLVPFRTGSEITTAANQNRIDVGYCGITPVTSAIDQNSTVKIVAAVNQEGSGIVVSENNNITNVSQFVDKKFLIPKEGGMQDVLFRYLLMNNNISSSSINITELETPLMQNALAAGKVDGYIAWEPYVSQADFIGNEDVFMYSKDIWPNHPCCVVITTNKFMKQKPDQLRKFLKIHVEATDYVNTHRNETAAILSKKLGTNINVEQEALKHVEFIAIPTPEFDANILKLIDVQKKLGYVKNNLTLEQVLDLNFLPT
jgi:NitT/TauT family transport system substrate-binding protein